MRGLQVAQLFEDFARRAMANPEEKLHAPFVAQLRQAGLLNLDDVTDRMLRILVELAVNHCLQVRRGLADRLSNACVHCVACCVLRRECLNPAAVVCCGVHYHHQLACHNAHTRVLLPGANRH